MVFVAKSTARRYQIRRAVFLGGNPLYPSFIECCPLDDLLCYTKLLPICASQWLVHTVKVHDSVRTEAPPRCFECDLQYSNVICHCDQTENSRIPARGAPHLQLRCTEAVVRGLVEGLQRLALSRLE